MDADLQGQLPLLGRAPQQVVFRRRGQAITAATFVAQARALAATLPDRPQALNICQDRYLAALGFAAALLRGQTTLLCADRSPARLRDLAARYPATYLMDDAAEPLIDLPLATVTLPPHAADAGASLPVPTIAAEHCAAIAFTSGSTGEPQPHAKPWGALVACARAAAARFGLDDPAAPAEVIGTVPGQHMYGFETTVMLPLFAAAASHAGDWFYPADVARALQQAPGPRRVLVTTPLQLRALLESGSAVPPLDTIISATAPLAPRLAAQAEAATGAMMKEIYGATECGSIASRATVRESDWTPYDGTRLLPDDTAAEAALVLVPGLPAAVPLADAVTLQPDGRFRLLGRRTDVVKLAGRRASLAALNRILNEVPGVRDGVFVAPQDLEENPSARLVAYVVAPGMAAEAVLAALRPQLEPVFLPRPVVMLEALPRDGVGKLSQRALAALRQA